MKQTIKVLGAAPAVLLVMLMSAPAYATDGTSSAGAGGETQTSVTTTTPAGEDTKTTQSSHTAISSAPTQPMETETSVKSENNAKTTTAENSTQSSTDVTESRDDNGSKQTAAAKGKQEVDSLKKTHKEHTAAVRQEFCNLNKNNLQVRFKGLTTSAQTIETNITGVYTKAQAFKASSGLTVANYDSLAAAAAQAQATFVADIANLTPPTLDCTSPTVATDVATFKVSAEQVRTDLKTYRDAVKSLVKAIKSAAASSSSTSTTSTSSVGAGQ